MFYITTKNNHINMLLEITNAQVIELYDVLENLKVLPGTMFAYKILKNQLVFKNDYDILKESSKESTEYLNFIEKRNIIIGEYFEQFSENQLKLKDENKKDEFFQKISENITEFKETIDSRNKQLLEFNDLLSKKVSFDIIPFLKNEIPDGISYQQLFTIVDLIEEDTTDLIDSEVNINYIMNFNKVIKDLNKFYKKEIKKNMIENFRSVKKTLNTLVENEIGIKYYGNFELKRLSLCEKYSEKDILGNTIFDKTSTDNQTYKIFDQESFIKELDELRSSESQIIDEYNKFLNDKVSIKIKKLDISSLPENLSTFDLENISPFLG